MTTPEFRLGVSAVQASAIVQVDGDATRGGLPVPRVTTTQRDAISAPATGLLVFNSTTSAYNFYSGAAWVVVTPSAGFPTTSAALAALISDETGSGALVFANTPTLVTPVLGVATGTSVTLTTTSTDAASASYSASDTVTLTADSATSSLAIAASLTASINQNGHNATAAAFGSVRALNVTAQATGASGTVSFITAGRFAITVSGGGTLTTGCGFAVSNGTNTASTWTNQVGINVSALTSATNNIAILLGTNTAPSGNWQIYSTSSNASSLVGSLALGRNATPLSVLDVQNSDSGTTTVIEVAAFVRNSSGTPAAGLGGDVGYYLKSSTTADTLAGRERWYWQTATHASRRAYRVFSAYDTAERDVIGIGASGSAAQLGFYGIATAPVVQPATTGTTTGFTAGAGTAMNSASTSTGGTGSAAYTFGDVILALKQLGLLAA